MKKEKEFNLSECGERDFNGPWLYPENYVKEFIKKLKGNIEVRLREMQTKEARKDVIACKFLRDLYLNPIEDEIDKLAGPKLIK